MDSTTHHQDSEQGQGVTQNAVPPFTLAAASQQIISLAKRFTENANLFAKATENFVVAVDALGETPTDPLDGLAFNSEDAEVVVGQLEMLISIIKSGKFPVVIGEINLARTPNDYLNLNITLKSTRRVEQEKGDQS